MKIKKKTSSSIYLKNFFSQLNDKKIFIITGKNSYEKSGASRILQPFLKNRNYKEYFKISNIPVITELKTIINKIKLYKPDVILAIGGGAVIDYAKVANYLFFSKNVNKDIINSNYYYEKKFSPLIAIPTTAGSGAEVTSNAVIYINKKKFSVENKFVRPDNFILIPDLIKKNKKNLKTAAGFDAIAQAVESLFSLKSNKKSFDFATKSLKLSLKNFLPYVKKANEINANKMLIASNLAGEAINISKTTAPHALSYPFTAHYNVSHGHAVAITFNDILKFNYDNAKKSVSNFNLKERFKVIFKLSNTQNFDELNNFFFHIKRKAKIKDNFVDLKIDIKKNLSKITKDINIQRLSNNPVKLNLEDINRILLNKN
jgi:alcohol dehydrogenase class IV